MAGIGDQEVAVIPMLEKTIVVVGHSPLAYHELRNALPSCVWLDFSSDPGPACLVVLHFRSVGLAEEIVETIQASHRLIVPLKTKVVKVKEVGQYDVASSVGGERRVSKIIRLLKGYSGPLLTLSSTKNSPDAPNWIHLQPRQLAFGLVCQSYLTETLRSRGVDVRRSLAPALLRPEGLLFRNQPRDPTQRFLVAVYGEAGSRLAIVAATPDRKDELFDVPWVRKTNSGELVVPYFGVWKENFVLGDVGAISLGPKLLFGDVSVALRDWPAQRLDVEEDYPGKAWSTGWFDSSVGTIRALAFAEVRDGHVQIPENHPLVSGEKVILLVSAGLQSSVLLSVPGVVREAGWVELSAPIPSWMTEGSSFLLYGICRLSEVNLQEDQ